MHAMTGTLLRVAKKQQTTEHAAELRELAGDVVWQRLHAHIPGRLKVERLVDQSGVSRSTLYKVKNGVEGPRDETYWAIAGALGLHPHLLIWINDGDVDRIKESPGIPDDLRHFIISAMADIAAPRNRRATDRRG